MRVVLFQMPRVIGGGSVEAGASALLWRKLGIDVTVLPAHPGVVDTVWPDRLRDAGCVVKEYVSDDDLVRQAWLFRSTVVDFAVERAAKQWDRLARMNCSLIHAPCHNLSMPHEHNAFRHRPPSAVVFQSEYQRSQLRLQYRSWGVPQEKQVTIHGAFSCDDFPYQPYSHSENEPFIVGVIGRPVGAKFPHYLASTITNSGRNTVVKGRWLGWLPSLAQYSGTPPEWIEALPPNAMPVESFLATCHCLLAIPDIEENWPRIVLEAFASGVPVVAWRRGGFCEQICHNETGILVNSTEEASESVERLATDELFRKRLTENARKEIASPLYQEAIASKWLKLFSEFS